MTKVLIKDLIIPKGTVFNDAPEKVGRYGDGHIEAIFGLTSDTYGTVYYSFDDLEKKLEKIRLIAYILAETKIENDIEYFHFKSATLLSGLDFDRFIENIENDVIKFDIRIGSFKSGIKLGKVHDHGSGFRIKRADIPKLFEMEEI